MPKWLATTGFYFFIAFMGALMFVMTLFMAGLVLDQMVLFKAKGSDFNSMTLFEAQEFCKHNVNERCTNIPQEK